MPRGEFPANDVLDADAIPVASSMAAAICAAQVVVFVVIIVMVAFIIPVPITTAQVRRQRLDGPQVGCAAVDGLEAILSGVETILLGSAAQGDDFGSPWP